MKPNDPTNPKPGEKAPNVHRKWEIHDPLQQMTANLNPLIRKIPRSQDVNDDVEAAEEKGNLLNIRQAEGPANQLKRLSMTSQ
tara:strand:- start:13 stop:261 length:249 start_codon:yes stop_codon:yes gene_type:complete